MNINPGELNKKIRIMKTEITGYDKDGFPKRKESLVRACYAKVTYTSGTEIIRADAEFTDAKMRFLVRHTETEINTSMFVRYKGHDHGIVYVNPYGDSKKYMELWTEAQERSGEENGENKDNRT